MARTTEYPHTRFHSPSLASATIAAAKINRETRLEGLAYAARWKSGRREEVLTRAAVNVCGLSARAAVGGFPYPHRSCAEWM